MCFQSIGRTLSMVWAKPGFPAMSVQADPHSYGQNTCMGWNIYTTILYWEWLPLYYCMISIWEWLSVLLHDQHMRSDCLYYCMISIWGVAASVLLHDQHMRSGYLYITAWSAYGEWLPLYYCTIGKYNLMLQLPNCILIIYGGFQFDEMTVYDNLLSGACVREGIKECQFSTFEHSLIFSFVCSNV